MQATFIDALKVPAVISTLRKIQYDAGDSLRILHGYQLRSRQCAQAPSLTAAEEAALDEVSRVTTEQTITALILFVFAHQAFVYGGVLAGQAAQIFISVNSMAAPKRQIVNPGEAILKGVRRYTSLQSPRLPRSSRRAAALAIGRLADWTGYHVSSGESAAPGTLHKTAVPHTARSLFAFKPLPTQAVTHLVTA